MVKELEGKVDCCGLTKGGGFYWRPPQGLMRLRFLGGRGRLQADHGV